MNLERVREILDSGQKLYAARAEWSSYSGSLVWGRTTHYPVVLKAKPNLKLGYRRNKQLGLIEDFDRILMADSITTHEQETPSVTEGFTVYISEQPFHIWIEHTGYTGDRNDSYNRLVESKPISSVQELLQLYE